jgi:hypothetical protein
MVHTRYRETFFHAGFEKKSVGLPRFELTNDNVIITFNITFRYIFSDPDVE